MATLKLETAPSTGVSEAKTPLASFSSPDLTQALNPILGSIQSVRGEIDDVLADMKVFSKCEPDQVLAAISAHSARLTEIVIQIARIEHIRREWRPVREECDRVLTELKSQFQVASRLHAMREFDFNASGRGQT